MRKDDTSLLVTLLLTPRITLLENNMADTSFTSTTQVGGQQTATPFQQKYFQTLLDKAGGVMTGLTPEQQAAMTASRQKLAGTGQQISQLAGQSVLDALGPYDPSRVQGAISAATAPVYRQLEERALPATEQAAIASGGLGGTRQGVAEGIARRGAAENVQNIASQLAYQDYTRDLAQKQNIFSNLPAITSGLLTPENLQYQLGGREQQTAAQQLKQYKDLISGEMGADITSKQVTGTTGTQDVDDSGQLWGTIGGAVAGSLIDKYL